MTLLTLLQSGGSPPPPIVVIDDTHDGDHRKRLKKRFDDEVAKTKKKRSDVILAYERIVEGRPDLAKEITKGFEIATVGPQNTSVITVDFDKLINDLARVELLWNEYLEMEDEDVMVLL